MVAFGAAVAVGVPVAVALGVVVAAGRGVAVVLGIVVTVICGLLLRFGRVRAARGASRGPVPGVRYPGSDSGSRYPVFGA
ncbi:hypothetical protein GCM10010240_40420 [Streptomyces griseoviridis]|nr:hypothetical protein GCM10010240_40420 [Streptomyces griseoviridis]